MAVTCGGGIMAERDPHARTRKADRHSWFRRHVAPHENWYRDFWLMAVSGIVAWGLATGQNTATKGNQTAREANATAQQAKRLAVEQRTGRRFAIGVTCAFGNATALAGRAVILNSGASVGDARFVRNLEGLGYKPPAPRQLRRSADAYVGSISQRVEREQRELGVAHPRKLVRKDGTLDCQTLESLADAAAAPSHGGSGTEFRPGSRKH